VKWEIFSAVLEDGKRVGESPPERAIESVRRTHVGLKGPMPRSPNAGH
jgi:hypothetical protein